jgi:V/A-type H+-transporting ATPase subunit E
MGINEMSFSEKIDNLMKEVIEDAQIKAEELIRQAEEKAKKNIEDAKTSLEIEVNQTFENMNKKSMRERDLKIFEAQMQQRNEVLLAKEGVIISLLDLIKQKLIDFTKSPKYMVYLQRAFKEMLNYISPGHYILVFNEGDLKKVSKTALLQQNTDPALQFEISQSEHIERHGILLKSKDQKFTIEDTLEVRFNQKKEQIRSKVAKLLFKN